MPSWAPVSSMTRISRTRMRSLTRVRSSRRGPERSKAICASLSYAGLLPLAANLLHRRRRRTPRRSRGPWSPVSAAAHRHRAFGHLAIADHQHVRHLLQLRFPNLVPDLLLAFVQFDAQAGAGQRRRARRRRSRRADRRSAARSPAPARATAGTRRRSVSISIAMNRSKLPKIARWITTGRCSALSAPMYFRSNRCGSW